MIFSIIVKVTGEESRYAKSERVCNLNRSSLSAIELTISSTSPHSKRNSGETLAWASAKKQLKERILMLSEADYNDSGIKSKRPFLTASTAVL